MEELGQLIKLIFDNGIGVVCVAFMIYFINTTLKENTNVLKNIQLTLTSLTTRVDKIENKMGIDDNKRKEKTKDI